MKIVFSKRCLDYSQPGHPESPERVRASYEFLKQDFDFVAPQQDDESVLLTVHSSELVAAVKAESFYDADTPNFPQIFSYAFASVSAALTACQIALEGEVAFSLMRPPGHHAGRDFLGGFCYFNNVAIAVAKALEHVPRVAIIDFDCHHGNGTQDIFLGREEVLYVSLHQSPWYPGTGLTSEKNCRNYPLPAGTDEARYLEVLSQALADVERFDPALIAVSAGFDAYKLDPLTGLALEQETFGKIGALLRSLGVPMFAVLEGGYSADMPKCMAHFLRGIEGKHS